MGTCLASHLAQRTADRLSTPLCACVTIALTAPNGGGSYDVNDVVPITWSTTGQFASFDLHVSRDGGSWAEIVSGLGGGVRSYNWTVDAPGASSAKIRVTGYQPDALTDESDTGFAIVAPADPWTELTTALFFIAEEATDSSGNVTTQPDKAGFGNLVDGGAPFLVRIGGGNRYGGIVDARLSRTGAINALSLVLRGRLVSQVFRYLGVRSAAGTDYQRLSVDGTNVVHSCAAGGASFTRQFAHGGLSDDVDHTFGVTITDLYESTFYLDGLLLGAHETIGNGPPPSSFGETALVEIGGAGGLNAGGAFVGGMVAEAMDAAAHANAHAWFVLNATP